MIVYGPVPSRRLGQSIGINNIPPKICPYSCIYCQVGRTDKMRIKREAFYDPEEICRQAAAKLKQLAAENSHADYFSFVPDGEPTLDINLGTEIDLLKQFTIPTAVITNASLLWMDEVREDLKKADWVSISVDAGQEDVWRKINRPHGALNYRDILNGAAEFSKEYRGTLVTETMLVEGVNDHEPCIRKIAERLSLIQPGKAYLLTPSRPPAEGRVKKASKHSLSSAAQIIRGISGINVECITGEDTRDGFFFTDSVADDLLSIASVHPVREDIVDALLKERKAEKTIITELLEQGRLIESVFEGRKFYRKNIQNK